MKSKLFSVLKVAFFLCLGLAIIVLFTGKLSEKEKAEIWEAVLNADYSWILLSMLFGTLAHISRSFRWKQLLEPMGHHPSSANTFFAVMVMYFANLAVPRLGEATRCVILRRYEKVPMEKSFGTVIAERAIDLLFLGFIFLITLIFEWDMLWKGIDSLKTMGNSGNPNSESEPSLVLPIMAIIGLTIAGILFFFRKTERVRTIYAKVVELIIGFVSGLKSAFKVKKPLWFVGHSLFIWFMYVMMVWICFFSMPETSNLPWESSFTLLIFGSLGIIIVPGGLGIYPAIMSAVLLLYGVPEAKGYAFGWIVWLGQTLLLVLWGIISLILLPVFNKKNKHVSTADA
ncbi:lysylphosphatidylglycerol synthase transmembrane domain-containing protein [Luteibaculum oceani]|uniref:Flippase-like domain-containing protein n=1 Tax=Luteibaculum oceani TaxID=1294296 RepID=A0A5C6V0D3_9FLAO|nr:lysylphosphatidylglycerol synthase transmembrane domain-containing protein [Luteibaculum oceani]TXC78977.1 flippase-like domain-containing protein [Luteibaculum oceani]